MEKRWWYLFDQMEMVECANIGKPMSLGELKAKQYDAVRR